MTEIPSGRSQHVTAIKSENKEAIMCTAILSSPPSLIVLLPFASPSEKQS